MTTITNPFSYFADGNTGRPLSNGYLYFGIQDTDPKIAGNQVTVRSIGSGGAVTEIDQPVRTNEAGVAVLPGTSTPFILDIEEISYSLEFQNSQQVAVYTSPRTTSLLPSITGEAGKFLFTDGNAISWQSVLPSQTNEAGKFLQTDGTNTSWQQVLPDQTGQAGKILTTDGTNTSWKEGLPDQMDNDGKFLQTDGTMTSWQDVSFSDSTAFLQNTSDNHNLNVVFPSSGKLLLWSSFQTKKSGSLGTLTLNLQGQEYESTVGNGSTNAAICTLILSGNPGDNVTINSTVTRSGSGFSLPNHITMVQPA